jgi:hypothetical protein
VSSLLTHPAGVDMPSAHDSVKALREITDNKWERGWEK